jgi:hypothetical protein
MNVPKNFVQNIAFKSAITNDLNGVKIWSSMWQIFNSDEVKIDINKKFCKKM